MVPLSKFLYRIRLPQNSRNTTPLRSKMLIGIFVLVKVLLKSFLAQPWAIFDKLKANEEMVRYVNLLM